MTAMATVLTGLADPQQVQIASFKYRINIPYRSQPITTQRTEAIALRRRTSRGS